MKPLPQSSSRLALITGAAVRVGREIALHLADQGWDIALHYHCSATQAQLLQQQIAAKGRQCHLVQADLADASAVEHIIPALCTQAGMPSMLINNAAIFEKDSLQDISTESWRKHMAINLHAPLMLMAAFAKSYTGNDGHIINISDGMRGWSISPIFLSYSLSKLGLEQATVLLARTLAPGIRINCIAPGATLEGHQDDTNTFATLRNRSVLGRTSSPKDICNAIEYLLHTPVLTGQVLSLTEGN